MMQVLAGGLPLEEKSAAIAQQSLLKLAAAPRGFFYEVTERKYSKS